MAIEFDGVNERIDYPNIAGVSGSDISIAVRFTPLTVPTSSQYLCAFETLSPDSASIYLVLWIQHIDGLNHLQITQNTPISSTNKYRRSTPISFTIGQTYDVLATVDSGRLSSGIHIYLDNSEVAYISETDADASFVAYDSNFVVGGRSLDENRNLHGSLADHGVWSAILTSNQKANYHAGMPPKYVRTSDLIFDARYVNGSSLDSVSDSSGIQHGTPSHAAHPTNVGQLIQHGATCTQIATVGNTSPQSDDRSIVISTRQNAAVQKSNINSFLSEQISITDEFEGGNCDASRAVIGAGQSPIITVYGRPNVNVEGNSPDPLVYSMAWRCTGLVGKTPTFKINLDDASPISTFAAAGGWPSGWRCWYSYDNSTWHRMANSVVNGHFQEVSHNVPFSKNTVHFATRPPYTYTMMMFHTGGIKSNPYVSEPPSSIGNDFVYGQTDPTTRDGDAYPVPVLDLVSYRISNDFAAPLDGSLKRRCVLIGRQHASEDQGSWQLQAFVNYLLEGSVTAEALLRDWEFFVYPMVNPSGVWGNAYRGTLQNNRRDEDPNRDWPGGVTAGRLLVVTATRLAIQIDTRNVINAFLDFHGQRYGSDAVWRLSTLKNDRFLDNVDANHPIDFGVDSSDLGIASKYFLNDLNVPVSVTVEGGAFVNDVLEYNGLGEAIAKGLNSSFLAGDFSSTSSSCKTRATLPSYVISSQILNGQRRHAIISKLILD